MIKFIFKQVQKKTDLVFCQTLQRNQGNKLKFPITKITYEDAFRGFKAKIMKEIPNMKTILFIMEGSLIGKG